MNTLSIRRMLTFNYQTANACEAVLYVSHKLIPLNKCTLTKLFLFSAQILSSGPSLDKEIVHKKLGSLPNSHMGLLT